MKVAVVGATGNVGCVMLQLLEERNFPADEVFAVASARSAGKTVLFKGRELIVQDIEKFDFSNCDIALFSAGGETSAKYSPKAAAADCVVVDNSSHFRMDPDVPLVVPEVNPDAVAGYAKKNIIANPNCSTIQMVATLKPLHDIAGIKRVIVSTYQAVSGAGKAAIDELSDQTEAWVEGGDIKSEKFTKQIALNAIPHIDVFMDDGATKEEWKMAVETDKIMGIQANVHATCVRVPVFSSHAEAVNVEFEKGISIEAARAALEKAAGVTVLDDPANNGYATQLEAEGKDDVFVSRLRKDPSIESGLSFWCVSDNLRKGAATNTVQIAELLVEKYLS